MFHSQNCRHGMKESNAIEEVVSNEQEDSFIYHFFRTKIAFNGNCAGCKAKMTEQNRHLFQYQYESNHMRKYSSHTIFHIALV